MKRIIGIALTALLFGAGAAAAQDYPARNLTWIVPQNPGGAIDTLARIFATAMGKELGQDIIVENRPGAGTTIGMQAVADAPPDGYLLVVAPQSSLAIAPLTVPSAGYDPVADFAPVYSFANVSIGLVASAKLGVTTLKELVDYAKAHPGELNYASGGLGTGSHFAAAAFASYAGIAQGTVHIPYEGGGQATVAVAAGESQFYLGPIAGSMLGLIESKQIIPLAVTGDARMSALPDVPTFAEAGLPEYNQLSWYGLLAPAGTPPDIVAKLNAAGNAAAKTPEVIKALAAQGIDPTENTPEEFAKQIEGDVAIFRKLVDDKVVVLEPAEPAKP